MLKRLYATHAVGLELALDHLKLAQMAFSKETPQLEALTTLPAEKSEDVKPLYMYEAQSYLLSSIVTSETLVRPLEIKLTRERDIDAVLAFQAEPLLPFPAENALLEKIFLSSKKNSTLLSLLAVRKDHLEKHLEQLQTKGIDPEVVCCHPSALAAFGQFFINKPSEERPLGLLHLGYHETACVLSLNGKLVASHAFPIGIITLAKELMRDLSIPLEEALPKLFSMDCMQITETAFPHLQRILEVFRLDTAKTLFALTKQAKTASTDAIVLTGEGVNLQQLSAWLSQKIPVTFVPAIAQGPYTPQQIQEYAVPIGLAVSALTSDKNLVNFRQGDLAYSNPWKHLKAPLLLYAALSCLVALLIFFLGQTWIGYQEDKIKTDYVAFLTTVDKSYSSFEKDFFAKKIGSKELLEEEIIPIEKLTGENLLARLEHLQAEIQQAPDVFPLLPNIPRVSDVLAWLSTHPTVTNTPSVDESEGSSGLKIDSFSYSMIKRPEKGKNQERYQVKVELEFSTPTPKLAREFHDALITPNEMVDPKGEIKWNASRDRYRTSFILKEKALNTIVEGRHS